MLLDCIAFYMFFPLYLRLGDMEEIWIMWAVNNQTNKASDGGSAEV